MIPMSKLLASAALATALVLSASVAMAAVPKNVSQIGGKVVDSLNSGPLAGVRVDVFADSGAASKIVGTTTTAKDGSFSIGGLQSGTYHLELEKRGYALEILTGVGLKPGERFLIARPVGMRTAVVTMGVGTAMETRL
jgi:5-hydroxyisourate hydrolase-like protein (transthyretin family)